MNKLYLKSNFYRIYHNLVPYLEKYIVSVNDTTSDLSVVTVISPIAMSATPLLTSAIIPFHDPLPDLEPYESVS